MKSQLVRVVLNPDRADDRRILDYFLYAGKPMSKLFKIAMLEYLDRQDLEGERERSLADIRSVIREELQRLSVSAGGALCSLQSPAIDDEPEVSPLDFLDQLEAMSNE